MKKILYCMHVGWNWIKQRPHFIAEELASDNEVIVVSDYCYRAKKTRKKNYKNNLLIHEFYKIPMFDHNRILSKINTIYRRGVYSYYTKRHKPDYLYVMTPNAVKCLPRNYYSGIVYDCMDDMIEFFHDIKTQEEIKKNEQALIDCAQVVLVSSNHLRDVLLDRYGECYKSKYTVIRNAHTFLDYEDFLPKNKERGENFILCYFGTIAEWFDFELIKRLLNSFENVRLKLIGPYQAGVSVFQHPQVENVGAVKHDQLGRYIEDVDAFIMPFIVNNLILSVDPVKLYEYIFFNKDIICVRYPEVERFDEYAYMYNGYEEVKAQMEKLLEKKDNAPKYSVGKRTVFLNENSWRCRVEMINSLLKK